MHNHKSEIENPESTFLKNVGKLVTANDGGVQTIEKSSILIKNGKIVAIGDGDADHVIDCGGKMVVHFFMFVLV